MFSRNGDLSPISIPLGSLDLREQKRVEWAQRHSEEVDLQQGRAAQSPLHPHRRQLWRNPPSKQCGFNLNFHQITKYILSRGGKIQFNRSLPQMHFACSLHNSLSLEWLCQVSEINYVYQFFLLLPSFSSCNSGNFLGHLFLGNNSTDIINS